MGIRLLGIAILVTGAASAQNLPSVVSQSQTPVLQAERAKLAASAELLHTDLPGFACTETAVSQAIKKNKRNPQKDKITAQVRFVADVRAERAEDGRLHESLDVTEVNGKPYNWRRFDPPIMVEGGFDQSLDFFLPARQACFNFTLSEGRIDFDSPPSTFDRKECGETGAPRGFALFDESGAVTHLERQVPPEYARQAHLVDFAAIDFVPAELGGTVYPLPAKMVAEVPKDGETLHFEASFAGCHLFKAISTILPGVAPVPEDRPANSHP
ncbi:MAG TPA: hypothetical protein VMQ60_06290 [Acidobacteriaceae bacterium]|jgi:hypothetical protein|nr:hypothetical protein [Acidobacteriaceae bacterium]